MSGVLLAGWMLSTAAMAVPVTAATHVVVAPGDPYLIEVGDPGDVDGDGIGDLMFGDRTHAQGAGRVLVAFGGGAPGVETQPPIEIVGQQPFGGLGAALAGGDVNCDGQSDLVLGAPGAGPGGTGAVYVFFGPLVPGSYTTADADIAVHGADPADQFGLALDLLADRDGDSCSDVLVGAPRHAPSMSLDDAGAAYVISLARPAGTTLSVAAGGAGVLRIRGDRRFGQLGQSVSEGGDHNGDGLPDVVLGASGYRSHGAAFVVHDSELGARSNVTVGAVSTLYEGTTLNEAVGMAVDGGRDVDGDGLADVVLGAPMGHGGGGAAYLALSSAGVSGPGVVVGVDTLMTFTGSSSIIGEFGGAVCLVGDMDGDGLSDIALGESGVFVVPRAQGRLHLIRTTAVSLAPASVLSAPFGPSVDAVRGFARTGGSIAWGPDRNGDGRPDPVFSVGFPTAGLSGLATFE